jgi:hypothetical protein
MVTRRCRRCRYKGVPLLSLATKRNSIAVMQALVDAGNAPPSPLPPLPPSLPPSPPPPAPRSVTSRQALC